MEEQRPVTRSCSRFAGAQVRGERPALAGCRTPASSLLSPQSRLDSYYAPSRKAARLSAQRPASRDALRQIRQKGGALTKPPLTGLLGALPVEVGLPRSPQSRPRRGARRVHCTAGRPRCWCRQPVARAAWHAPA